ncbi:FG-GAP repeat protein [Candidatus Sumerlaeota bacterium]|nr:FG-GAP repeat protein [Candidatus Sumerlaeota bacterium]
MKRKDLYTTFSKKDNDLWGNHRAILSGMTVLLFLTFAASGAQTINPGEQSEWIKTVQQNIMEEEYHVSWQEECLIPGEGASFHITNRAQNLRAYFFPEEVQIISRGEASPSWVWSYRITASGNKDGKNPITKDEIKTNENCLEYQKNNIIEKFENSKSGISHSIIIPLSLAGRKDPIISVVFGEDLGMDFEESSGNIVFLKGNERVIRYQMLGASDAKGGKVICGFSGNENGFDIKLDETGASYPLEINILISAPSPWEQDSDQVGACFGHSVACAGDVNGDGYSDVIIGAPDYDNGHPDEGRIFLYMGGANGLATNYTWWSESNQVNAYYGNSVSTAGDVNGDGYADVIVGSPYYDVSSSNDGEAIVFYGHPTIFANAPATILSFNQEQCWFGNSVSTAGDVDGDGYSDIVVGAPLYLNGQTSEGAIFVFKGSADGIVTPAAWIRESNKVGAQLGASVGFAGDVNGDGYGDVIIGAPWYSNGENAEGKVCVYHGGSGGLSTNPSWEKESNLLTVHLGESVAGAGDVNGDGYSDVIVGVSLFNNGQTAEGQALVYHGGSGGLSASPNWSYESNISEAILGWSVSTAGDIDGDGCSEVIIGAYRYHNGETDEGAAYLFMGSFSGLKTTPGWIKESNQENAHYGHCVACAGDVNGDGYSDMIVGAPLYDNGQADEGAAFLYYGKADPPSSVASRSYTSDQDNSDFAFSLNTAGDVNGDGYDDILIGAPMYDNGNDNEGRVYVYHGIKDTGPGASPNRILEVNTDGAYFGWSVSTAGSVNGDRYDDIIVGAPLYASTKGAAFVFHGSSSGVSATPDWQLLHTTIGDYFGRSVSIAGDVNGDGYSDVIVGAPFYWNSQSKRGRVLVYHGSSSGLNETYNWDYKGIKDYAYCGYSVSTAGDVNGDGYSDIIIGGPFYDNGEGDEGVALAFYGSSTGLPADYSWKMEMNQALAEFGTSVSTAGDVNGDGYSDVIVGAPGYSDGIYSKEGVAFIFNGSSSGLPQSGYSWKGKGGQANAMYGHSVSAAGDVNGDGYSDIIVGAYKYDFGAVEPNYWQNAGAAYVYHGSNSGINGSATWMGYYLIDDMEFGYSVSGAGDVNGDGYADVIVGSRNYTNAGGDRVGFASLYLGGGGQGRASTPRQVYTGGITRIAPLGLSNQNGIGINILGRSPFGRSKVKPEWEVKQLGDPLNGAGTTQMESWTNTGTTGAFFLLRSMDLTPFELYHWRVRMKHSPVTTPLLPASRWITMPTNGMQEADFRAGPSPTPTTTPTATPTSTFTTPTTTHTFITLTPTWTFLPTQSSTPTPTPTPTPQASDVINYLLDRGGIDYDANLDGDVDIADVIFLIIQ